MQLGYVGGHGRKDLFSRVGSQATQGSSVDFGQHEVQGYSRFTGLIRPDSAGATGLTFRWRMGINSGAFQVSSSITVGSGGAVFDQLNHGRFADFAFTAIDSTTTFGIVILGEPLR